MADLLVEIGGRRLIGNDSLARNGDRRNAAGVHQTLDTGRATGLKEISGPDNVAVVDVARITCPKPIIRGHVKHLINTADNWRDRRGVAEISVHDLQGKVPNGVETAG